MSGDPRQTVTPAPRPQVQALVLAALTLALFAPAIGFDGIHFDDPVYVFQNPHVMTGLRLENIIWAFSTTHESWWLPLLWISYMADVSFFGPAPWGFHLTNILLHTASVVLLFLLLRRTTGQPWLSAFVAALFAIHPLRLESVVWIAERKDVLSGFFWMLGLWSYVRYVENRVPGRYALVALLMVLGLMSKASAVTFPAVLLLLDFWPLRRFERPAAWKELVREKVPLLLLSAIFSVVTISTHVSGRGHFAGLTWLDRLNLIPRNYMAYLGKLIWPVRLSVIYPEDDRIRWGAFAVATLFLLAVTAFCVWQSRRRPFLPVGWLWFIVTLLPVIRGVRLGLAAMADRFTYVPSIGLFVAAAWGFASALSGLRGGPRLLRAAAIVTLSAAWVTSAWNLRFWRDSESLFNRALAVTEHNYQAASNLADYLWERGRREEAMACYQRAVDLAEGRPRSDPVRAGALFRLGRLEEAESLFQQALQEVGPQGKLYNNLGLVAFGQGHVPRALEYFQEAVRLAPNLSDAQFNYGLALVKLGRTAEAMPPLRKAVELNPYDDAAHFLLGQALAREDRREEALGHLETALRLQPSRPDYQEAVRQLTSNRP